MISRLAALLILGSFGAMASAEGLRDFCPDRPGLVTPPCTIDPGHFSLETGIAQWTLDKQDGARTDSFTFGDELLRYGLGPSTEVQVGWQAFGIQRTRDADGTVTHSRGTGDVRLAVRQNLKHPDGSGFSIAAMPYVTLPTGRGPLGAGTWAAGMLVPVSYKLTDSLSLTGTAEIDHAANSSGEGHHLAYSGIAGVQVSPIKTVTIAAEVMAQRDEQSSGGAADARSSELAGLSVAWMRSETLQLDAGANVGLHHAADVSLYAGVAKRF